MAWQAVDKDGSIKKLIGRELKWENKPVEI